MPGELTETGTLYSPAVSSTKSQIYPSKQNLVDRSNPLASDPVLIQVSSAELPAEDSDHTTCIPSILEVFCYL